MLIPAKERHITAIERRVKNALRLLAQVISIKKVKIIIDRPIAIAIPNKTDLNNVVFSI